MSFPVLLFKTRSRFRGLPQSKTPRIQVCPSFPGNGLSIMGPVRLSEDFLDFIIFADDDFFRLHDDPEIRGEIVHKQTGSYHRLVYEFEDEESRTVFVLRYGERLSR